MDDEGGENENAPKHKLCVMTTGVCGQRHVATRVAAGR
jgi:hypothetical protein